VTASVQIVTASVQVVTAFWSETDSM